MRTPSSQQGLLLVTAIFLVAVVAVLLVSLAYLNIGGLGSSTAHNESARAYYAAYAGIEYAKQLQLTGTTCGSGLHATQAVGDGSFTVSGATQYTASNSTLSAAVGSTDTTIPVGTMGSFAPFGRIIIGSEEMYYGGISGNNFINVQRGTGNTLAAAHSAGDTAYQGACHLRSTGTAGTAKRVLDANVPVQLFKTGVITKKSTAGAGTVGYTGVGFKPSVLIFFWTLQTATGLNDGISSGMGFATPYAQYAAVGSIKDNSNRIESGRRSSASNAIIFQSLTVTAGNEAPPALLAQASLQSMDADGFTLNWNVNGDANAYRIYYIALGGDTQGYVGNFDMNNATGDQAVTGTGFKPELLIFAHAADGAIDTDATDAEFGLGFARTSSEQGAMAFASQYYINTDMQPRWQQLTDKTILFLNHAANPPTAAGQASLVSMDSNGFTINVSTASGGANWNVGYLALRGVRAAVGAFDQPTVTGTQTPLTALAFRPQGLMLASRNLAAATTLAAARTSIGAGGAYTIAQGNIWHRQEAGTNTANTASYNDATNIISHGLNGPPKTTAQASLQSLDFGGFTLNWGLVDTVAREILYWLIGPRDYADIREGY